MKKLLLIFFIGITIIGQAQVKNQNVYVTKGKGFEFHFFDNSYLLHMDFRGQFRASYPFDGFPADGEGFNDYETELGISRARIKIGGYVLKPYYNFYFEQDIKGGNLLDFRAQLEKLPYLKLRVGQWKARYSRERVISSGKQEGLERSLINSVFTIDRQQGISLYGDLGRDDRQDFQYWASVFMGTGRGGDPDGGSQLMYMLRLQYNPIGVADKFSGSDLKRHERFTPSIAIAGVTNESAYTSFSTRGGGQLYGFEPGVGGQYKVDQGMFETAFKYKGWAWQQEFHYKRINDQVNLTITEMIGNYVQLGYFLNEHFSKIPKQFEVFSRFAFYDANIHAAENMNYEYTLGCNWFFKGHKNKLTFDYSYLEYNQFNPHFHSGNRFRLQWDVSIF